MHTLDDVIEAVEGNPFCSKHTDKMIRNEKGETVPGKIHDTDIKCDIEAKCTAEFRSLCLRI